MAVKVVKPSWDKGVNLEDARGHHSPRRQSVAELQLLLCTEGKTCPEPLFSHLSQQKGVLVLKGKARARNLYRQHRKQASASACCRGVGFPLGMVTGKREFLRVQDLQWIS